MPRLPRSQRPRRVRPGDRGRSGIFRSLLGKSYLYDSMWERRRMEILDCAGWRFEREAVRIPYMFNNQRHYYLPDLVVYDKWGRIRQVEEIKPTVRVNDPLNQAKFAAAHAWCKAQNIPFVIVTERTMTTLPMPLIKRETPGDLDKSPEQE